MLNALLNRPGGARSIVVKALETKVCVPRARHPERVPSEHKEYDFNFDPPVDPTLQTGETISTFSVVVDAAGAALGVAVSTSSPPALLPGDTAVQFHPEIALAADRNRPDWLCDGTKVLFTCNITTTPDARTYEESGYVQIRQK